MIQPVKGGLADLARGNWAGSLVVNRSATPALEYERIYVPGLGYSVSSNFYQNTFRVKELQKMTNNK